jgi:alpha-N-arabinofuranosidase
VRYDGVDLADGVDRIEFRTASASQGGLIEIRLDRADGELLGTCVVPTTGDWQQWKSFTAKLKPVGGVRSLCLVFRSRPSDAFKDRGLNPQLWFAQVDQTSTTIWAQFTGVNPNEQTVEINVRQSVFYPDRPGRNYITVRGFTMRHAATPWAPPTAEQIGLLGTHWSKGWVIEDNVISHSVCCGITLGKHGDEFDNTSANTAEGYVKTIERAHAFSPPWTKENIGHHLVRNNHISHCEQAGIVGSLGAAFSTISGNTIHDVHIRRLFSGAEMSGIKLHAAIDTTISRNHIFRCCQALWLDWMAQGTRVTRNVFHDNEDRDLFMEVNHGPYLVDNNLFLSPMSLLDVSEGGAFVHNLFLGRIISQPEPNRETPYHPAHSTMVAGLARTQGGDNRFYYNLFVGTGMSDQPNAEQRAAAGNRPGSGLWVYDRRPLPLLTEGNVYFFGATPYVHEDSPLALLEHDPAVRLDQQGEQAVLEMVLDRQPAVTAEGCITTERLGKAAVSGQAYENADGSPITIDSDYFGVKRGMTHPTPGPFEKLGTGVVRWRIW